MTCTCLDRINGLLAEHNTKIVCTFPMLGNKLGMTPSITTRLVEPKRGAKPMSVIPTFCPFCGIKYSGDALDPADPWRGLYDPTKMPKLDGVNSYHVAHPDLPSWPKDEDEERGIGPLVTAQGFALESVFGEYPDDDGDDIDYCAWLANWEPDAPAGAEWRLVCIQDTEDGPAASYVRPLALIERAEAAPNMMKGPVRVLADHAAGRVSHANNGLCPDQVGGVDSRDPDCTVCRALINASEAANG